MTKRPGTGNRMTFRRVPDSSVPLGIKRKVPKQVADLLQIEGGYVPGKYALADWLVQLENAPKQMEHPQDDDSSHAN